MKKSIFVFFFLFSVISATAQPTTAQDWTKTDCAGNSHHLFSYLDSNQVAVMLFEMGCGGCVDGGKALEGIKQFYDSSKPGKVHFFAMDYWAGQNCTADVIPFLTTNNFTYPGFDHCLTEKEYYTSQSPMPMIVVAAGPAHSLFYFSISYIPPDDSVLIFNAIDSALTYMASSGINESGLDNALQLFPNPSVNEVTLSFILTAETIVNIEVVNVLGENMLTITNENKTKGIQKIKINTENFSRGIYFVNVKTSKEARSLKFVVK